MKVPEYVLKEEWSWDVGPQDRRTLPAGAHVKPVEERYVPVHVKETWKYSMHRGKDPSIYVYTRYGFVAIPASIVRRVD